MPDTSPQRPPAKVMLLTKRLEANPSGGRELLCKVNYHALKEIYRDRLVLFELAPNKQIGVRATVNAFRGHIDGLDTMTMKTALDTIQSQNVIKVFADGSNLGAFVTHLKKKVPHVEVITFFHNVEARFFWGSLRVRKSPRALAVLAANYLAERQAVRHSAKRVCLCERDSRLMRKLYGRGATHISPMALEDKLPTGFADADDDNEETFAIFVGSMFYANRTGITWFTRHVASRVAQKICILGKGLESIRGGLEVHGNIEVIGHVDSLAEWYRRANYVIAPIFDGSGMKTKVAEALMYGKRIVGTPEAFSGYEEVAYSVGWVCRTPEEFAEAMGEASEQISLRFDPALRKVYEERYSERAATERMKHILEDRLEHSR